MTSNIKCWTQAILIVWLKIKREDKKKTHKKTDLIKSFGKYGKDAPDRCALCKLCSCVQNQLRDIKSRRLHIGCNKNDLSTKKGNCKFKCLISVFSAFTNLESLFTKSDEKCVWKKMLRNTRMKCISQIHKLCSCVQIQPKEIKSTRPNIGSNKGQIQQLRKVEIIRSTVWCV